MEDVRIEAPFAIAFPLPFRVIVLGGLGILCWATNLHGLNKLGIDVAGALELRTHDAGLITTTRMPSPSRSQADVQALARSVYRLFVAYATWSFIAWILFRACSQDTLAFVDVCKFIPAVNMLSITMAVMLPLIILERHVRDQLLVAIKRCCASPLNSPIHFSDVILADIITSFAKVIGDVWLSLCMFLPGGSLLIFPPQEGWSGMMVPFLMSVPYLIRFRQCVVEYMQPTNSSRRPIFNALKYASSFPVIFLSAAQRSVVETMEDGSAAEHPLFRLWLLSVAVNSLYSFWWDITNDWGLELLKASAKQSERQAPRTLVLPSLHPRETFPESSNLHPRRTSSIPHHLNGIGHSKDDALSLNRLHRQPWGLRSNLLYPIPIYPLAIFANLILRLTWSVKLSSHLHEFSSSSTSHSSPSDNRESEPNFHIHGAVLIFWIEVAELLRRWMWVFFRVEWECVKKWEEGRVYAPEIEDLEMYATQGLNGDGDGGVRKEELGKIDKKANVDMTEFAASP